MGSTNSTQVPTPLACASHEALLRDDGPMAPAAQTHELLKDLKDKCSVELAPPKEGTPSGAAATRSNAAHTRLPRARSALVPAPY